MEQPVTFKNNSDQTLFGILHIPDQHVELRPKVGINLLNPGLKNRVAPNRLNIKIARMLCERGFFVLRFDPHGTGDSEGQLSGNNENLFHMWGMIQKGEFVNDTIEASSFFIEKFMLDELILIGQCGGGATALLCGGMDIQINKLILIDTPFRIVSSDMSIQDIEAQYEEPGELIRNGFQALFNPQKIKKVITSGFKWRSYLNAVGVMVLGLFKSSNTFKVEDINERFNWQMQKAFDQFVKRDGKIYLVFAENDLSLKDFNHDFRPNFLNKFEIYQKNCKMDIIKNANHIYTEIAWQDELIDNIIRSMSY